MFNYKFYLNNQKKDKKGLFPIMLLITFKSQRLRKAIPNVKAQLHHWDENKQRINKQSKDETDNFSDIHNGELIEIENRLIQLKKEIAVNMVTFSEDLLISRIFKNHPSKYNVFFYDKFDEYIELKRTSKAERTVKSIVTSFNKLRDFETDIKYKISYESINLDFFEKFGAYMLDNKKYGFNYFSKIISSIKAFMSWSEERGYTTNNSYKKFKAPEKETDIIALDEEELLKLLHFEFKNTKLEKIRDVFCFSCFTGLRFSDLISLRQEHIQDGYIIKNVVKTKERIRIPLTVHAQLILDKYKDFIGGPLPVISAQKYNDYLKECCKEAKLDKATIITKNIGNSQVSSTHPKHELITSHVGRKTFATLSLVLGMSSTTVKLITGHKRDKHFNRYVAITETQQKNDIDKAWSKL